MPWSSKAVTGKGTSTLRRLIIYCCLPNQWFLKNTTASPPLASNRPVHATQVYQHQDPPQHLNLSQPATRPRCEFCIWFVPPTHGAALHAPSLQLTSLELSREIKVCYTVYIWKIIIPALQSSLIFTENLQQHSRCSAAEQKGFDSITPSCKHLTFADVTCALMDLSFTSFFSSLVCANIESRFWPDFISIPLIFASSCEFSIYSNKNTLNALYEETPSSQTHPKMYHFLWLNCATLPFSSKLHRGELKKNNSFKQASRTQNLKCINC